MRLHDGPATMWANADHEAADDGTRLLFGRMYEDCSIERRVFAPRSRVFCIASAGDTALTLASVGHEVTAVDVNPAQIAYVRDRMRGGPLREGAAERFLRAGRRLLRCFGLSQQILKRFLACSSLTKQRSLFDRLLSRRMRLGLHVALTPVSLRRFYNRPLRDALPAAFAEVLWARLRRGFGAHLNSNNPYARRLLLNPFPRPRDAIKRATAVSAVTPLLAEQSHTTLHCDDAAAFLEDGPPGRFDAFSLSNILDGADAAYGDRLFHAVRHAASRDAALVLRTFAEPAMSSQREWALRDRALIWGSIRVEPVHSGSALIPPMNLEDVADVSCSIC